MAADCRRHRPSSPRPIAIGNLVDKNVDGDDLGLTGTAFSSPGTFWLCHWNERQTLRTAVIQSFYRPPSPSGIFMLTCMKAIIPRIGRQIWFARLWAIWDGLWR